MKGLLLTAATAVVLSGAAFSQMMMHPHGYHPMMGMGGMMMHPHGYHPMMGMGGMMMMYYPETQKIAIEHMLRMMIMYPKSFKEVIKKNPELRDKLRELLE